MPTAEDGSHVPASFYSQLGPGIYRGSDGRLHRTSRAVAQAARRFIDQQSQKLAEIPAARPFLATVTNVAGTAITVRWRGGLLVATAAGASYTPAVDDRVLCLLIDDQLVILDQLIGA